MSENPYAQAVPEPGQPGGSPVYMDAKTSILAVVALVLSALGFVTCCLPAVGLVGVLGTLVGAVALFRISASAGRLKGSGLAIAAVVLGLVAGAVNVAAMVGVWYASREFARSAEVVQAIEARDVDAVRAYFDPAAAGDVTEQRLAAVSDEMNAAWGGPKPPPQGLLEFISLYGQVGGAMQGAQSAVQAQYPRSQYTAAPLAVAYDNGVAVVFLVASSGPALFPLVENIAITLPDGSLLWVRPVTAPPGQQGGGQGQQAPPDRGQPADASGSDADDGGQSEGGSP